MLKQQLKTKLINFNTKKLIPKAIFFKSNMSVAFNTEKISVCYFIIKKILYTILF